jgi:hypothetical protein
VVDQAVACDAHGVEAGRIPWIVGALVTSFAACSLGSPLEGLSGGPLPGEDAGPDASGSGGLDGGGPVDAAPADAADAGEEQVDAGPICQRQVPAPLFFADFDEGDLNKVYESGRLVTVNAPVTDDVGLAKVGEPALSPPGAFLTEVPASDGGVIHVRYEQPLTTPAKGLTMQFQLRLVEYTVGQKIDFGALFFYGPDAALLRTYVGVAPGGKGNLYADNGSSSTNRDFSIPADGEWHQYRLDYDIDPLPVARIFVDDAAEPSAMITITATFTSSTKATFYLGPTITPPSKPLRIAIDDVTVTAR